MSTVYVGLDLGSSNFHQVAINDGGLVIVNRFGDGNSHSATQH
jgi:hypothetical protein